MKKILFLFFIATLLIYCSEKLNSDNSIKKLKSICDIGQSEVLNDGSIHYSFGTEFSNEIKIKGCFDKGLGILPQKIREHKKSALGDHILNFYEYETLEEKVIVENHFITASETDSIYIECRIWITKK